ncbi:MAG: thiamine phosphate synthase [Pseudomonadota bacterium]
MADTLPTSRLYLIAPARPNLSRISADLARILDRYDIACIRISSGTASEDDIMRAADTLRPLCHAHEVPIVLTDHFRLVAQLGLDGVHLSDGARQVRAAREALGRDAVVGVYAHDSRHEGMTAGEIGADYVSFGPVMPSSLGDGRLAPLELFQWWSEMIEVPVLAEGGLTEQITSDLSAFADFICLGDEIWSHPDGAEAALQGFQAALRGSQTA